MDGTIQPFVRAERSTNRADARTLWYEIGTKLPKQIRQSIFTGIPLAARWWRLPSSRQVEHVRPGPPELFERRDGVAGRVDDAGSSKAKSVGRPDELPAFWLPSPAEYPPQAPGSTSQRRQPHKLIYARRCGRQGEAHRARETKLDREVVHIRSYLYTSNACEPGPDSPTSATAQDVVQRNIVPREGLAPHTIELNTGLHVVDLRLDFL